MNVFCFVDKVWTRIRKYSNSFYSQICSSFTEQRIGHRTYALRLISLLTSGQYHKDNHSILQEVSTVNLFDSDSDNSVVYQDISLLFCNVTTLVAGAAMISKQITTRTLFYVMICHLYEICRYEKKYLVFSSVALLCSKSVKIVYMNEYGTECKTNISAYGFWPNKSIIWYFIYECLFRSMNGMHKTRCIYFSDPLRLKLQWSYLHGV